MNLLFDRRQFMGVSTGAVLLSVTQPKSFAEVYNQDSEVVRSLPNIPRVRNNFSNQDILRRANVSMSVVDVTRDRCTADNIKGMSPRPHAAFTAPSGNLISVAQMEFERRQKEQELDLIFTRPFTITLEIVTGIGAVNRIRRVGQIVDKLDPAIKAVLKTSLENTLSDTIQEVWNEVKEYSEIDDKVLDRLSAEPKTRPGRASGNNAGQRRKTDDGNRFRDKDVSFDGSKEASDKATRDAWETPCRRC